MSDTPVGIENVGFTITSAVRMHSEGECDAWSQTSEDFWVVLGHNEWGEMICWNARLLDIGGRKRWSFFHGEYVDGVIESFLERVHRELGKMVSRSKDRATVKEEMAVSE